MKIGLTSDKYKNIPITAILYFFHWLGVRFSEVTVNIFNQTEKSLQSTRGMELGLHLPNFGNCGYDFSSTRYSEKIETVLHQISLNREKFHFQYAVFHTPEEPSFSDSTWDFYFHNLKQVNIPLILENTRSYPLDSFISFYQRFQAVLGRKLYGVCLDIPHAFLSGGDWHRFYRVLKPDIKVIHLSDCTEDEDLHLPFGLEGTLPFDEILETLRSTGFNGVLNFEIKPVSIFSMDTYFETFLKAKKRLASEDIDKVQQRIKWINRTIKIIRRLFFFQHFSTFFS